MQYDHILVRYGELSLKGKNRKVFYNRLHENIRHHLKAYPEIKIKTTRDRLSIFLNGVDPTPLIPILQRIFGIQTMSLAIKVENEEEAIKEAALFALTEASHVKTFKVTTKRADKTFPIDSQQMNQFVGGHLLRNTDGITVDVHQPDVEIHVDIRPEATYVTSEKIPGRKGLPVGTAGKTLLLLSGGFDSPVAGYLMMQRGVRLEMIHFYSPPYTSEAAKQKVLDLTKELTTYGGEINVHIVPFTALQQKLHREIPHGYSMTVMRRMMLKIAERIASKNDILSITTGESLGQVASQTMESMHAINAITHYPIMRPLIAMDKSEIMSIAEEIGTYPISIRPFDDCCTVFVPNAPKTKPKKDKVEYFEGLLDLTADIEACINDTEVITIKPFDTDESDVNDLF